jgi:hypothetical protein
VQVLICHHQQVKVQIHHQHQKVNMDRIHVTLVVSTVHLVKNHVVKMVQILLNV